METLRAKAGEIKAKAMAISMKVVQSDSEDGDLSDGYEIEEEHLATQKTCPSILEDIKAEMESRVRSTTTATTEDASFLKGLVSKQKKRFIMDGFDLDLTYITDQLIAMGFPAPDFEKIYRNNMIDVQRFFQTRHPDQYRIYNLCETDERSYDPICFNGNVARFPFPDHNPPPFKMIYAMCQDIADWCGKDPKNVVAIHCKAGKGRTGVMVCSYLLYKRMFKRAIDALMYYGMIRTNDKKGVTIPSQLRYVYYFAEALNKGMKVEEIKELPVEITTIKLITVPNFNILGGCEPWFTIKCGDQKWDSKALIGIPKFSDNEAVAELQLEGKKIVVQGDVKIEFFNNSLLNSKTKMFQLWFNTAFFDNSGKIQIDKNMLDGAWRDKKHKKFAKDFAVEIDGIFC